MNYDNFEKYIRNKEVYSNDLNIILTKTPPRLFRLILLAITLGLLICAGFAFFIKIPEFAGSNFVLQVHPNHAATITWLSDEPTLKRIAGSRSATLQAGTTGNNVGQKEVTLTFDSLHIIPVYELNGNLYDYPEQVKEKILTAGSLVKKYKVSVELDSLSARHYFGSDLQSQAGSIKFILGERRLIQRFINI